MNLIEFVKNQCKKVISKFSFPLHSKPVLNHSRDVTSSLVVTFVILCLICYFGLISGSSVHQCKPRNLDFELIFNIKWLNHLNMQFSSAEMWNLNWTELRKTDHFIFFTIFLGSKGVWLLIAETNLCSQIRHY